MQLYYVYGLLDPRTNEIFYIGKGKGKRVLQHLNEKEDIHTNTEKLRIINEIQSLKLSVDYIFIGENLKEEEAFLLEKLLIYRFGRKIFDQGKLTNIAPGGKWHKDASLFIKEEKLPTIDYIQKKFPVLVSILEKHPKVSKEFTGLKCPLNPTDNNLYDYSEKGTLKRTWNIDNFIKVFGLGHALDVINSIKDTSLPVYAWYRIWSKTKHKKLVDISRIPFQDFDELDLEFINKVNSSIKKNESKTLECFYSNNNKRCKIELKPNLKEVTLTYFYENGVTKHITTYQKGMLNGKCEIWFQNGQLQEETLYKHNDCLNKKCFYESGQVQMVENYTEDGVSRSVKTWHKNGQIDFVNNEDGTSYTYSENGILLEKSIRSGELEKGGELLNWEYYEDGSVKSESKMYYINRLLHGYEKFYYTTGELRKEIDYTHGYNNKVTKNYKKNGELSNK